MSGGTEKRIRRAFIRRAALLMLAGLAAAPSIAQADDCCRYELRVRRQAVLSDKFDVELYAHFPASGHAFAGGTLNIRSDGVNWTKVDLCGPSTPGSSAGVLPGTDVIGIAVGQLSPILGGVLDTSNPILVWCGEFESNCPGAGYRKIWTDDSRLAYYTDASGATQVECDPVIESHRSVFCGPMVIDGWLAAPAAGTKAEIIRDTLVLTPERLGGAIGVAVGDERIDWSGPAVLGAQLDVGGLPSGATLDLVWFPWVRCWSIPDPWITLAATKKGDDLIIKPDFSRAGISTVPVRAYRDGKLVGEGIVPTGGSFALHRYCSDLWWCYELNQFDQLVLVLKCKDWFMLSLPGQPEVEVDRIELAPRGVEGAFGGVDRLELKATGIEKLTVLDVGDFSGGGCYADCDESGGLDFFDFLCFQDAFGAGDRYADCDGSGELDFFDFLCFQNEFAAACP
jgi:hypothetical protein